MSTVRISGRRRLPLGGQTTFLENGVYTYKMNGKLERLPLRANHYWAESPEMSNVAGSALSSLSLPSIPRRGVRRISYVFRGEVWVTEYMKVGGHWKIVSSLTSASAQPQEA